MNKRRKTMMNNKKMIVALAAVALLVVAFAAPAAAVQLKFNGDMNHRFILGTNHNDFIVGATDNTGSLDDGAVYDNKAEIKYRYWFEAVSDDSRYKGVFATEIGGLSFGQTNGGYRDMRYSGDSVAMEVRWGYFDFQLPFFEQKSRVRMGLQPVCVNYWLWKETVGAVKWFGEAGSFDYQLGWMRGYEVDYTSKKHDDFEGDQDAFYGRLDFKPNAGLDVGILALYQMNGIDKADLANPLDYQVTPQKYGIKQFPKKVEQNFFTLGTDGHWDIDQFFVKWDLMYQGGSIDQVLYTDLDDNTNPAGLQNCDVKAYFLHADAGMKLGKSTLTYTFWYASGDDDPFDDDLEAFLATDVDIFDGIILFEGGWADDDYFTERPYMLDRGLIMNKLALDYQYSERTKLGVAGMYMMTAEDLEYTTPTGKRVSEDTIGFEIDAYVKFKLFKNVELAVNAGYLFADDAMDYFEVDKIQDGSSDEDIFRSDMRIRYKF
ncbi:MAG: hypothetical protein U9N83_20560 [Thermodesulfobacteriota bacterium]|nr:hypothetical protein [Thermodesulfobacteriota bacterium]